VCLAQGAHHTKCDIIFLMPEVNLNQSTQTTQPPQKPERNWKKILLILLIALFVISLLGVGLYLLIPRLTEEPTPMTQPQKQATPSAKPATPSAKKDETEGWKTLHTKIPDAQLKVYNLTSTIKFSFKYPPDFRVVNDNGTDLVTDVPTYPGLEPGRTSAFGALGGQHVSNPTDTTLGGMKAIKVVTNKGTYINTIYSVGEESILGPFQFVCVYAPQTGFDGSKLCDLMASTFKFLD